MKTEREELAKLLGDHYGTSAGGDDYLWSMADILIERGFGKVRESLLGAADDMLAWADPDPAKIEAADWLLHRAMNAGGL
jgi:hypothetical protein